MTEPSVPDLRVHDAESHGLRTAVACIALMAIATLASATWLAGPLEWDNSDSLFYEAQRLEILGRTAEEARSEVFGGEKARAVALIENQADPPHVLDAGWVDYSAQFYRRRWSVPLIGAALDPVAGDRGLQLATFLGYLALGPSLLLLLTRRFSLPTGLAVSAFCLVLPPVHKWSTNVGVDTWGLVLEVLAFVALVRVIDRGLRWLPLWIGALVALSFTRDAGIVLLLAAAWIAVRQRGTGASRRNLALVATAIAAIVPALLVFRTSVRDQLAYVINNYYVPVDRSWSFVLDGYPSQVGSTAERNLSYPLDFPLPIAIPIYVGMAGLVVLLVLFLVRAPREPYFDLHRGAVLGYALFLAAAANPQGYRLELVALPTLAVVLAFWARIARRWLALQREGRRPRALDVPSCTWVSCGC